MELHKLKELIKETIQYVINESQKVYYRGVDEDELKNIMITGKISPSRERLQDDYEVTKYLIGDDINDMDDHEIEMWWRNELGTWYDNKNLVNVTTDISNARGYGDFVVVMTNPNVYDFSSYGIGETNDFKIINVQDENGNIVYEPNNSQLNEYIVKKGYSLTNWKQLSDKDRQDIVRKNRDKAVWRVVHGHKHGKIGTPINSYLNPDGTTKYSNYDKASKIHTSIVMSGK